MASAINLYSADYWRQHARDVRGLAESMTDPNSEASLLAIAAKYEALAERIAERARRDAASGPLG